MGVVLVLWMLKLPVDPSGGGNTCSHVSSPSTLPVFSVGDLYDFIPQEMQKAEFVHSNLYFCKLNCFLSFLYFLPCCITAKHHFYILHFIAVLCSDSILQKHTNDGGKKGFLIVSPE